jgi:acetate kinase
MEWCGLRLDLARNAAAVGTEGCISVPDASLKVYVIAADEERIIARETGSCVSHMKNASRT